jgi:hypothetical protein
LGREEKNIRLCLKLLDGFVTRGIFQFTVEGLREDISKNISSSFIGILDDVFNKPEDIKWIDYYLEKYVENSVPFCYSTNNTFTCIEDVNTLWNIIEKLKKNTLVHSKNINDNTPLNKARNVGNKYNEATLILDNIIQNSQFLIYPDPDF